MLLSADGLGLSYGATVALVDASLVVEEGEVLALVGPSGSGKSSLLHCLAGLLRPDRGVVVFDGEPMHDASDDDRADLRRAHFGFVFQFAELLPELTLWENIALPLELNKASRAHVRSRVGDIVDALGLGDQAHRRPHRVSGGQAQRAAIGRAVAHRPRVVFADEPTGSLDGETAAAALDVMVRLVKEDAASLLLVTHEAEIAATADRVVRVRDGRTEPSA